MATTADNYVFRGTYDVNEVGRIESLLNQQRQIMNAEDAKQNTTENKVKKYAVILLGATTLLIILKIISK